MILKNKSMFFIKKNKETINAKIDSNGKIDTLLITTQKFE
jgi:hypothetical protein